MYRLLESFEKRGKLLRQENAVTSTSKLTLFYHCSVLKLKCGFQSLREHGTRLETHANIGAKFCLAINDLWHCAIHFVNWSLNLQDHIRIFQFALEECKVEPYFFIVKHQNNNPYSAFNNQVYWVWRFTRINSTFLGKEDYQLEGIY